MQPPHRQSGQKTEDRRDLLTWEGFGGGTVQACSLIKAGNRLRFLAPAILPIWPNRLRPGAPIGPRRFLAGRGVSPRAHTGGVTHRFFIAMFPRVDASRCSILNVGGEAGVVQDLDRRVLAGEGDVPALVDEFHGLAVVRGFRVPAGLWHLVANQQLPALPGPQPRGRTAPAPTLRSTTAKKLRRRRHSLQCTRA
eukprot:COSAG04_NODE_741_length_10670_cov_20.643837_4_plen_195_part_00